MAAVKKTTKVANAKVAKKVPRNGISRYGLIEHGELVAYIAVVHLVLGYLI